MIEPSASRACGDTAAEHCRVIRFTDNDLRSRAFFLQHPRHAFERSAGTKTGDPVVESVIGKSRKNLRCRRSGVRVCVGLVLELSHEEPIVFFREFNSLGQHATAFERRRCEYDLGAQEAHHLAALEAEALCHCDDERVAFLSADHRKTDTRIAAGRLDDGLTRFQCVSLSSASSMTPSASRSLTEPIGLKDSILT